MKLKFQIGYYRAYLENTKTWNTNTMGWQNE
jgi:hypothetical protein